MNKSREISSVFILRRSRSKQIILREVSPLHSCNICQISCGDDFNFALSVSGDVYSWGKDNKYGKLGRDVETTSITFGNARSPFKSPVKHKSINEKAHEIYSSLNSSEVKSSSDYEANSPRKRKVKRTLFNSEHKSESNSLNDIENENQNYKNQNSTSSLNKENQIHRKEHSARNNTSSKNVKDTNIKNRFSFPNQIDGLIKRRIIQISAGTHHSAALSEDGLVYTWGQNAFGKLGLGDFSHRYLPTLVTLLKHVTIVQVSCGVNHTACLDDRGRVYLFGWGTLSADGEDDRVNEFDETIDPYIRAQLSKTTARPRLLTKLPERITKIQAGGGLTLCLADNGRLYSWAPRHSSSKLQGNGYLIEENYFENRPQVIKNLAPFNIIDISCGPFHSLALDDAGRVFSWGIANVSGILGRDHTIEDEGIPLEITEITHTGETISHICCGMETSVALSESGRVFIFGQDTFNGKLLSGASHVHELDIPFRPVQVSLTRRSLLILGDQEHTFPKQLLKYETYPEFQDLQFNVGSQSFKANAAIVQTRMPEIRSLIEEAFQNFNYSPTVPFQLQVNGLTNEYGIQSFRCFLHYIYTDELKLDAEYFNDLSHLAHVYKMERLQHILLDFNLANIKKKTYNLLHHVCMPTPNIREDMMSLRQDRVFSDISLVVSLENGETVPVSAHKIILTLRSEFFSAMFTSEMQEANNHQIYLEDLSLERLEEILDFIYGDKLNINNDNAVELTLLANKYNLYQLQEACQNFIKEEIIHQCNGEDEYFVTQLLDLAKAYSLKTIEQTCIDFMDRNNIKIE